MARRLIHLEDLLGRRVVGVDGQVIGRIGEVRAERHGDHYEITEYLIGPGALLERLSVVGRMRGRETRMRVARWDQVGIRRADSPHLTCPAGELKVERPREKS